jgi:hypothetical protein
MCSDAQSKVFQILNISSTLDFTYLCFKLAPNYVARDLFSAVMIYITFVPVMTAFVFGTNLPKNTSI